MPESVLVRAREIAEQLSENDVMANAKDIDIDLNADYSLPGNNYGVEQQEARKRKRQKAENQAEEEKMGQLSLFGTNNGNIKTDDIIIELHDLDLANITPIDALNVLYKMQTKLRNRV